MMTENRLIVMKRTQTLYLLFISGFYTFALGSLDFHVISMAKNYAEAKAYCREMYTDLATVHNSTDMDNLVSIVPSSVLKAWIGLETGDVRLWHWSQPDQELDFINWKAGEPQLNNEDACAAMDQSGNWVEYGCGTKRSFVCHGNSDAGEPVFIAETKSWRNAQNHCRTLSSDLISIHSAEENEAVRKVSVAPNVWIGLFKDPWKWSDGSKTSFRYWIPSQPNYLSGQNCVAAIFRKRGQWNDLKCVGKRNFVCRGARRSIPTTTLQTSTQETTANLTTLPNTSTPEVTVTYNVTVTTTQSHTTVTTEAATTANEATTPNTTDLVSSTSSTELNNVTTNVTSSQPPTTISTLTTDIISTSTTSVGTSGQTTQSSTLKPTESSESFPTENIILIQENMTWSEALDYCREHHTDLVHITNEDIQGKVAEIAKNSTTPHVWLGLRYTCKFNFWFWTKSIAGCYQNWAPGQGLEGIYDCGVTGAIETTGRQQWVGLPETDKLNFICYSCTGREQASSVASDDDILIA